MLRQDADEWQRRRQLVMHALRPEILTDFVEVFAAQAQTLVERLRSVCDGKSSFDVQPYVESAVLDVLIATAVGVESKVKSEQAQAAVHGEYAQTVLA